jgi:hypothetical protein
VYRAPQRYAIPAARIAVGLVQHASRPLRAWEQLSEEARAATTRTRSRCRAGLAGLAAWLAGLAAWLAGLAAIGLDRPDDPRFLVYSSVWPDHGNDGEVFVECEMPGAGNDPLLLFRRILQFSSGIARRLECSHCILKSGIDKPEEFFLALRCTLDLVGNADLCPQTPRHGTSQA